jgi:predicted RNase H-like HicB family nuclease
MVHDEPEPFPFLMMLPQPAEQARLQPHSGRSLNRCESQHAAVLSRVSRMKEITFNIERCEESNAFVASWDDPDGHGGITTQGHDLQELEAMIKDAVRCHFDPGAVPDSIRLHFKTDPVLATT